MRCIRRIVRTPFQRGPIVPFNSARSLPMRPLGTRDKAPVAPSPPTWTFWNPLQTTRPKSQPQRTQGQHYWIKTWSGASAAVQRVAISIYRIKGLPAQLTLNIQRGFVSFWGFFWLGVLFKKHTSVSIHTYFLHPAVKHMEIWRH